MVKILEKVKGEAEERKGVKRWIGGDFIARMGERGALEDGEEERERVSKDKVINRLEVELVKWVEEEGWGIINGVKEGDKEGKVTFTGRKGKTVIDYVMEDRGAWERVERLEVGEEVDSDHQSVWLGRRGKRGKRSKEEGWIERVDWSEKTKEEFRKRTEEIELRKG